MPPTTVPCNPDAYPQASEAAKHQTTHTYYAFESSPAEKAGFSDPDSAWFQKENSACAPLKILLY